eukprot:jgi/Picsp_1/1560/NSC_05038-R1_lysine-specific demethylase no66-like
MADDDTIIQNLIQNLADVFDLKKEDQGSEFRVTVLRHAAQALGALDDEEELEDNKGIPKEDKKRRNADDVDINEGEKKQKSANDEEMGGDVPSPEGDDGAQGYDEPGLATVEEACVKFRDIKIRDPVDAMRWMIQPLDDAQFFDECFEVKPFFISRPECRDMYQGLFGKEDIERLLDRDGGLLYSIDVDVTRFADDTRENYNYNGESAPRGERVDGMQDGSSDREYEVADPKVVWQRYKNDGCSVRLLHPQRFVDSLWEVMFYLESYWNCCIGCNAYLTPAGTQGFAPHWDDIDAFVLQLEGKKKWKLYSSVDPSHVLPRYSSKDFDRSELGDVTFDQVLQPGDLLYLPRGVVHEAQSLPDEDSLHITISANQRRNIYEFIQSLLPLATEAASQLNIKMRRTLHPDFLTACGSLGDPESPGTAQLEEIKDCMQLVISSAPVEVVADRWQQEFMIERLPPPPSALNTEKASASGSAGHILDETSKVKVACSYAFAIIGDLESVPPNLLICHCLSNPRSGHAITSSPKLESTVPPQLELPVGCLETVQQLLADRDNPIALGAVQAPQSESGVTTLQVAQGLLDAGLLVPVE